MDKNTIVGLFLIAAVLIGFWWYNTNQERNLQHPQAEQTSLPAAKQYSQQSHGSVKKIATDSTDIFFAATKGKAKDITLQNAKIRVKVSTKGGSVESVELKEYKSYQDFEAQKNKPLLLYSSKDANLNFLLDTKENTMDFSNYYFEPVNVTDSTVTMRLTAQDGATIDIDYKLLKDNYLLNFDVKSQGMQKHLPSSLNSIQLAWHDRVSQHEKGFYFENMYSTLTYKKHDDDTKKLSENETEEESVTESVDWIAFKNQYFSSVLMAADPMQKVNVKSQQLEENSGYLKNYSADMAASFDASGTKTTNFQFYFGPNNYRLLQSMDNFKVSEFDNDLQDLVYLGWPIVKWINRFFTLYVFDFLTKLGLPMGVVLLLITLLIRVIVYVPTRKSFLSSAKMRVLKPKVDAIAAKYPKQCPCIRNME